MLRKTILATVAAIALATGAQAAGPLSASDLKDMIEMRSNTITFDLTYRGRAFRAPLTFRRTQVAGREYLATFDGASDFQQVYCYVGGKNPKNSQAVDQVATFKKGDPVTVSGLVTYSSTLGVWLEQCEFSQ
jgi:hypothetical protein